MPGSRACVCVCRCLRVCGHRHWGPPPCGWGVGASFTLPLVRVIQTTLLVLMSSGCRPQAEETDSQACCLETLAECRRLSLHAVSAGLVLSRTQSDSPPQTPFEVCLVQIIPEGLDCGLGFPEGSGYFPVPVPTEFQAEWLSLESQMEDLD